MLTLNCILSVDIFKSNDKRKLKRGKIVVYKTEDNMWGIFSAHIHFKIVHMLSVHGQQQAATWESTTVIFLDCISMADYNGTSFLLLSSQLMMVFSFFNDFLQIFFSYSYVLSSNHLLQWFVFPLVSN